MSGMPTKFEMRLLDVLQDPLPLVSRPFEVIADRLNHDEASIIAATQRLRTEGWVRRFRGRIDYRALGRQAVLVAASVPEERLASVVEYINALPGVSHNYLRDHEYNLWFTLQDRSREAIDRRLEALGGQTGVSFHAMEALQVFKLDVRFRLCADSPARQALPSIVMVEPPGTLTNMQRRLLEAVQHDLPLVPRPFAEMAGPDASESQVIAALADMQQRGVLRHIAAMVDYRRLGYVANGMLCLRVDPDRIGAVGPQLAESDAVSHCYERRPFAGFPYNLFAMMHARSADALHEIADGFIQRPGVQADVVLHTVRELKKQPVRIVPDQP
ncbi:MAG TPA: Lrp/AsnC family transcriptional regulator [Phycisphaerales bacterium]|nr:Lrp/AsnC family transcriptional regulator [Phycisphaerales bacterium]